MFQVNGPFYEFLSALQDRLKRTFTVKALSEMACLLHDEAAGIRIIYYLGGAGHRVPVDGNGRCIHLDEDLWITRGELLLNRIAALVGHAQRIHARDTVVARIEKRVAMPFLEEHHLQVALPGKYRYGLYGSGELVAVAVFSGGRRMADKPSDYRSFELLRFCHKQGVHIVGGFSKLLDGFRRDFNPGDIMTYADKDWSDGTSYHKMGFTIVGETVPQLFWVDRRTMQRYYESTLPPAIRTKPANEWYQAGYVAVYNSGSIKLVKHYHPVVYF
ncbi:hypothetical protein [Parapedobacter sp. 2B3]|uniref:hypothetical protein n=1 Tax=Parapedobacter sp. 2B3 TaxID=3342381 RepID=UPI0035B5B8F8